MSVLAERPSTGSTCSHGLQEVRELPRPLTEPSLEEITHLGFTMIDPMLFQAPAWLLSSKVIDAKTACVAFLVAKQFRDGVEAYDHYALKLAYFQGVLDSVFLLKKEYHESGQVGLLQMHGE